VLAAGLAALLVSVGTAQATHTSPDTLGHTTVEQRVDGGDPAEGYQQLGLVEGEDYVVRDGASDPDSGTPIADPNRPATRESLAYFSQMTDFQLADEESPARVEFVDQGASSAWRPWEALNPFMIDASVRQINAFADNSPFPGSDAQMDIALMTGDQADNNQRNETIWVRELLEGGEELNFNSGLTDPAAYSPANLPSATCQAFVLHEGGADAAAAEGAGYTGVQDYDDYPAAPNQYFYDPDEPAGDWHDAGWPTYTGLMDRAQTLSITPAGLHVPTYIANGNHDVLVQGNEDANQSFEDIATGCTKVLGTTATPPAGSPPDPNTLFFPAGPPMLIPPDEQRQFTSKPQIKQLYGDCEAADAQDVAALQQCLDDDPEEAHGFAFVDPAELDASNGSASYYAWDPPETPGARFISIDTNSEGGQTAEGVASGSSNGNIDDPQFQWLEAELQAAQDANKLIVLFGHHPVRSMTTPIADEQAPPCTGADDGHGHDPNPGCDLDPRFSQPLHLGESPSPGESFVDLLARFPNVIAYVSGHTHEHRLTPFPREDGTTWWEINTAAVADWPTQSRLIEMFDNNDGTLSIFSAVIDHASNSLAPPPGDASGFNGNQLGSIGRTFAYNDPQNNFSGEGLGPEHRNVEVLLDDPRDGVPNPPGDDQNQPSPGGPPGSSDLVLELDAKRKQAANKITVTATCPREACDVKLGGKATAPGDKAKLKKEQAALGAGESEKFRLKPKKGELRELKDALDDGTGKAKIKGRATSASGATDTDKLTVKLKR
jgi:hypothetical protein